MNESAAIDVASEALSLARAAGAESAEASVSIARRFHAEAREDVVSRLEGSTGKSLFLRVFRDGRKSTLSTSDLSSEGLREAVAHAVAHADLVASDEYAGLPDLRAAAGAPSICSTRKSRSATVPRRSKKRLRSSA